MLCTTRQDLFRSMMQSVRAWAGKKQTEAAEAASIGQSGWARVERGQAPLTFEQIEAVSRFFGLRSFVLLAFFDELQDTLRERSITVLQQTEADAIAAGHMTIAAKSLDQITAQAWQHYLASSPMARLPEPVEDEDAEAEAEEDDAEGDDTDE